LAELLPEATRGLAHPELASLAARMMDLSIDAFSRFTTCYTADGCQAQLVAFRDRFTARGRTPGDELAGEIRRGGGLTVPLLHRLEETWAKVAANTP
jgi:hypothetical protein